MASPAPLLSEKQEFVVGGGCSRLLDCFYLFGCLMIGSGGMAGAGNNAFVGLTGWVIALLLMVYVVARPTVWKVCIHDNVISFTKYRVFGLCPTKPQLFSFSEIGFVVLDCRRGKWFRPTCGLNGLWRFSGIYATRGFPTPSRPMEIAFELPTNCCFHSAAFASCVLERYQKVYVALCEALHCKWGQAAQATPGPGFFPMNYGWINTAQMYQNQMATMGNMMVGWLESATDFRVGLSTVRNLPTNRWKIDVDEDCMRTTIVVSDPDGDPNLELPDRLAEMP